jgi:hypothetical protein
MPERITPQRLVRTVNKTRALLQQRHTSFYDDALEVLVSGCKKQWYSIRIQSSAGQDKLGFGLTRNRGRRKVITHWCRVSTVPTVTQTDHLPCTIR